MEITALVVKDAKTNEVLFVEGIEDSSNTVQIIIPLKNLSEKFFQLLLKDKTPFNSRLCKELKPLSKCINLGEITAYSAVGTYEDIIVSIEKYQVPSIDQFSRNFSVSNNMIAVLLVYSKETKEILFAEGTDPDGYRYHQVFIPNSELYISESDYIDEFYSLKSVLGKELEAKNILGDYEKVNITIKCIPA